MADEDQALIAAEHARRQAIVEDDADALESGMADMFHYAHINGMVEDKAAFLTRISAGAVKTHENRASELKVALRGGYALLTGRSFIRYEWTTDDRRGITETLFLAVWEKHDGAWRIVAYSSTPLPGA